jgi:hypothetical protein
MRLGASSGCVSQAELPALIQADPVSFALNCTRAWRSKLVGGRAVIGSPRAVGPGCRRGPRRIRRRGIGTVSARWRASSSERRATSASRAADIRLTSLRLIGAISWGLDEALHAVGRYVRDASIARHPRAIGRITDDEGERRSSRTAKRPLTATSTVLREGGPGARRRDHGAGADRLLRPPDRLSRHELGLNSSPDLVRVDDLRIPPVGS